jgi:hypothetical protein
MYVRHAATTFPFVLESRTSCHPLFLPPRPFLSVVHHLDYAMSASSSHNRALETVPIAAVREPNGRIPNTPLAASTISFLLGCGFSAGIVAFITQPSWMPYQLAFFLASWAAFHWGEFAVTAGWNREKCSVDCVFPFIARSSNLR